MEYRCRVATASGQVMEATYVADSEARLRLELEEKGLYLLSVQGKGGLKVGGVQLRLPRRRKIPSSEFIIFNQELATLLKAGLPLVQSLDILRKRVPNPYFKAALDDVYEKVRSGSALSEAFEAQKLFSGVYTASLMAGEKSGSLEQVIRRYVQHTKVMAAVRGKVISALIYPAVLICLSIAVVSLIVFKVVPEFAAFYGQEGSGAELPMSTRIVVAISTTAVSNAILDRRRGHRAGRVVDSWHPPTVSPGEAPCLDPQAAVLRAAGAQVCDSPGVSDAGDTPLWWYPAGERARYCRQVGWESPHFGPSGRRRASGPRGGQPGGVPGGTGDLSRMWPSKWLKWASLQVHWPIC